MEKAEHTTGHPENVRVITSDDLEDNTEYSDEPHKPQSKTEQSQMRMMNIKIRGLETALDKLNFEKTEVLQEKDQLEKEIKILDEQRRRLDANNRNLQSQLERSKGELVDVRHNCLLYTSPSPRDS